MKVVAYWAVRTALFLALVAVLWLAGGRDLISVVVAFVMAWLLGYILFPGMRREAALQLDGWIESFQNRHRADDADEDHEAAGASGSQMRNGSR